MIAFVLALAAGQSPDFSQAMEAAAAGRYAEAAQRLEGIEDELERAQGEVFVRLRAGDLFGALRAADRGLEHAPEDLWLLERRASTAVSVGSAEVAGPAVRELSAAVDRADARKEWQPTLVGLESRLEELEGAAAARGGALLKARFTVFASLGALLLLLLKFARRA